MKKVVKTIIKLLYQLFSTCSLHQTENCICVCRWEAYLSRWNGQQSSRVESSSESIGVHAHSAQLRYGTRVTYMRVSGCQPIQNPSVSLKQHETTGEKGCGTAPVERCWTTSHPIFPLARNVFPYFYISTRPCRSGYTAVYPAHLVEGGGESPLGFQKRYAHLTWQCLE